MNIASILQNQLNVIKLGHYGAGVFRFPFFIFIISFSFFFFFNPYTSVEFIWFWP